MVTQKYLGSIKKQFIYYKHLADSTLLIIPEDKIHWQYNTESNSIAIIIQHLAGSMLSRFTDFLTSDGEKEWRNRDEEFEQQALSKSALLQLWDRGWEIFMTTLNSLEPGQLESIVYIRNEGHTVLEALNRQLAHYPYHIGQIAFLGKMIKGEAWESLSIPKGNSVSYNKEKFNKPKQITHFVDGILGSQSAKPSK